MLNGDLKDFSPTQQEINILGKGGTSSLSLKSQQPLLTTWKCWRRSSRRHGHWLTQELDSGKWRLLYPSPLFIINVPLKPYYCMIIVIDIPIPDGRKWNRHRKEFAILMIFRIWPSRIPFPVGSDSKCGRPGFYLWVGKISWRRAWQPTPVFLPREFQGQRSLEGCSPQGHKQSDMTERLSTAPITPRVRVVFKDSDLREPHAIETIWTVHVTEPVKDSI